MPRDTPSTLQKALEINLDLTKYGTIAEIGAGQETARYFFQAGGAAGTIAKSMSAYDMQFSNAIYGEAEHGRYVSRSRLNRMLETEFDLLQERIKGTRPLNTTFFAFANTVAARGYKSNRECHGWVGVRLQLFPDAPPSNIIAHVRMLDTKYKQQQEALGIMGVNLIYAAFFHFREPEKMVESLLDNLASSRLEIDMISMDGPYFEQVDNRLIDLHLVRAGVTKSVMFAPTGEVMNPAEIMYKKNVLIFRGSFRPVTHVNMDITKSGKSAFFSEPDVQEDKTLILAELTMANLLTGGDIDTKDFLARIDILGSLGFTVMISNYLQYSRLRAYISTFTKRKIGIVLGVPNILSIFDEKYYTDQEGGILESFGKLFKENTKLYIYPCLDENGEIQTAESLRVPNHLRHLYKHLHENGFVQALTEYDESLLKIESRQVLKELKLGDGPWKESVPEEVYRVIVENKLFGYDSE